jgi:hypothetical protein
MYSIKRRKMNKIKCEEQNTNDKNSRLSLNITIRLSVDGLKTTIKKQRLSH